MKKNKNVKRTVILFTIMVMVIFEFKIQSSTTIDAKSQKTNYNKYSGEKHCWYIVRGKNHAKTKGPSNIDFSKYDAYFIDNNTKEKVIYLTFDCGYENGYTKSILKTLKKHNAKATFFVTKQYVKSSSKIIKQMKKDGNLVGNHTLSHRSMPTLTVTRLKEEINGLALYYKNMTGYNIDKFIRPPMGEYSKRTLKVSKDLGYKTIFWSMAMMDYDVDNQPGKAYVINHFNKYYHKGAIPLIHNISKSDTEALDKVLSNLESKGYRFALLSEL